MKIETDRYKGENGRKHVHTYIGLLVRMFQMVTIYNKRIKSCKGIKSHEKSYLYRRENAKQRAWFDKWFFVPSSSAPMPLWYTNEM